MSIDTIIIGAGVSGLTAAQKLNESGSSFLILEARSRIGGRVWTDQSGPIPIDMGAHWIHTFWFNPLVKLASKHGVDLYPNEYQRTGFYTGGKRVHRSIVKKARIRFNYVLTALEEGNWSDVTSIEDAVKEILLKLTPPEEPKIISEIVMAFLFHLVVDNSGLDLKDVNLNVWKKGEEDFDVDGGDQLPEGGMWSLFKKEFENVFKFVKTNCEVTLIDYSDSNLIRIQSNCGSFTCNNLIVTVPIMVLQTGTPIFKPPLPTKYQEAINSFQVGILNCITIKFTHTFWNDDDEFIFYLDEPDNMERIRLFSTLHHTSPGLLIAWTYGEQGKAWEKLSDQEQIQRVINTLGKIFSDVPPHQHYRISRWHSDPYARGSYSGARLGYEEKQEHLLQPIQNRIFFSGEVLAERYGTVDGACLVGAQQAEKLLEKSKNNKSRL